MIFKVALIVHVLSTIAWVGGVFMASWIDTRTLKNISKDNSFPFDFLIEQGRQIFPFVYFAIVAVLISGTILTLNHLPAQTNQWLFWFAKWGALLIMTINTVFGTIVTWPKIQFSNDQSAWVLYKGYKIRAYITFLCGILASVLGILS